MRPAALMLFIGSMVGCGGHLVADPPPDPVGDAQNHVDGAIVEDSSPDASPAKDAPGVDPTFGCAANKAPRTCWKCCENVPSLLPAMEIYFRDVMPCMCKHPVCGAGCAHTCEQPTTTPYKECSPCLQAHADECLDAVSAADLQLLRAFLACTAACPTSF